MTKKKRKTKKTKKKGKPKFPFILIATLLIAAALAAYMFLSPLSMVGKVLFQPVKTSSYPNVEKELFGAKREDVFFKTAGGVKLHGFYFKKPGAKYTFILNHGQGGNIGAHMGLVKTVLLNNQSVLTYDYEGYGISDGAPSLAGLLEDGKAAFDFLVQQKGISPKEIIEYGASMGTGVASTIALTKGAAAVILIAPYTSMNELAKQKFPYLGLYHDVFFPRPDIGCESFVRYNRSVPVLIIHVEKDDTIPLSHSLELAKLNSRFTRLSVLPERHHGDFSTEELALQIGVFLEQELFVPKSEEVLEVDRKNNAEKTEESK